MKIGRRTRREDGPRFTITGPNGPRIAKHSGESLAMIEAQNEALASEDPVIIVVSDDGGPAIFTVVRGSDNVILTYEGEAP